MKVKRMVFCRGVQEGGSSFYRIYQPAKHLRESGSSIDTAMLNGTTFAHIENHLDAGADMLVMQYQHSEKVLEFLKHVRKEWPGVTRVMDVDDCVWALNESNPNSVHWPKEKVEGLNKILMEVDAVTTTTYMLAGWILTYNPNIYVILNYIDWPMKEILKRREGRLRIGWAGSPSHVGDFSDELIDALLYVKRQHGVELIFCGYLPEKLKGETAFDMGSIPTEWIEHLNSLDLDIGVLPLADTEFNICKSELKAIEYAACGIATVASPIGPYRNLPHVRFTIDCMDEKLAWITGLETLIRNNQLRNNMQRDGRNWAYRKYFIKNNIKTLERIYNNMHMSTLKRKAEG